ncbi:MAG: radical SAM protein [Candidatus Omnitrophica bacterium]|nr:radical SAM protein [Candidatus Omnitrophota bacterium]
MKTQSYHNFWQRIHKSAKNRGFPLRVMFELTYQCNFYCKHCYVPLSYRRKAGELKTKEVFSILGQLADIGCFYLGFTGGEPFLRKDIMEIFRYAKKKGFEVIIYTNGSLINEEIADELATLRPNKVDITIPAMSKKALEKITRAPNSHKRIFKAIDLLYKRRVELGFKTCVLKENESEIKEIQDFAVSLGALHRLDDTLSPRLNGSKEPYKYRGRMANNRGQSRLSVIDCRLSEEIENRTPKTENLFKCGVGKTQAAITPFGELKMCLMIDYPKYKILTEDKAESGLSVIGYRLSEKNEHRTPSLKSAWEKLKDLVKNIKPDENYQCDRCEFEPYCKWCPAKAWLHSRTFTSCVPESRGRAEERRQLLNC